MYSLPSVGLSGPFHRKMVNAVMFILFPRILTPRVFFVSRSTRSVVSYGVSQYRVYTVFFFSVQNSACLQ